MANMASNRMIKEYDPVKKVSYLRQLNSNSADFHEIYLVNPQTGERVKWGSYKPLDKKTVSTIQGRLGDLLHPTERLRGRLRVHDARRVGADGDDGGRRRRTRHGGLPGIGRSSAGARKSGLADAGRRISDSDQARWARH